MLRQVVQEAPARPRTLRPAVPPALEAVCLKALAKRSEERARLGDGAGRRGLRHWLAGDPVAAYPEPWPARRGVGWAGTEHS